MTKNHRNNYMERKQFNWEPIAQPAVLLLGILAAVIPLHLSIRDDIRTMEQALSKKIESNRIETQAIIQGIREDMREFHGRLCAIEERNRK